MSASSSVSAAQLLTGAALVATSLGLGYAWGVKAASGPKSPSKRRRESKPAEAATPPSAEDEESDSEMEEEDLADGDLSSVKPGSREPCKMVLVVRTDLKMTTGKIAAQCGHATLACYKALQKTNPALLRHWERTGQAKVALKANSEDELLELEAIAKSLNLCARSILDAGRTQIAAGSRTVLGIGPGPIELVNKVTGKLRLL
ncbi:peptidyl-tRNA hydrolase 2 [Phanerochaete sordida]|uniref:peptidyl-tRNA hydrolase n=1 Tax=Phanerochaete sordida TaxID=48140 RepID=A0A9P3LB96_9APHY|nr:peptidyl-tRNA hydrolase 2 [Phanerochaete sordida]